ncbi:MAG: hypothetical protein AAF491_07190 [Verrucomicrobiota bacterium]
MPDKFTTRTDYQRGIRENLAEYENQEGGEDLYSGEEGQNKLHRAAAQFWAEKLSADEHRRCLLHFYELTDYEQNAVLTHTINRFF